MANQTPAQRLGGIELQDGWRVIDTIPRSPGGTGGYFSHGYLVQSQAGIKAYLKALDYSAALRDHDPARALQQITTLYNFERDLCVKCRNSKLDRVVNVLADGSVTVDPNDPASAVQYLIFELAEGDVRSQMDRIDHIDNAWILRSLHHVATGLKQLHGVGVAHQDLKPSNVLMFEEQISKVADLGRASSRGETTPYDEELVAGDMAYAPPELLYGHIDPDWNRRRLACDMYLLGSLLAFFYTRSSLTSLIKTELAPDHLWTSWGETYDDVLPYVRDAFGKAVVAFGREVPEGIREVLVNVLRQLGEPDPKFRGSPSRRGGSAASQFSLEQYISKFDLLASRAELDLIGR